MNSCVDTEPSLRAYMLMPMSVNVYVDMDVAMRVAMRPGVSVGMPSWLPVHGFKYHT